MGTQLESDFSSGSLIERIKRMDQQGWEQFVEIYGPLIHRWCLQCGLTNADSLDLLQEVLAKVVKSIENFQATPDGNFRGWLWMVTRNQVRDFLRSKPSRFIVSGGTDHQLQLADVPDSINVFDGGSTFDPTSDEQNAQLLHRAMASIRPDFAENTWHAFYRSVVQGEATADIAADLKMSSNGVRQAKCRVLRRLRQQLGQ